MAKYRISEQIGILGGTKAQNKALLKDLFGKIKHTKHQRIPELPKDIDISRRVELSHEDSYSVMDLANFGKTELNFRMLHRPSQSKTGQSSNNTYEALNALWDHMALSNNIEGQVWVLMIDATSKESTDEAIKYIQNTFGVYKKGKSPIKENARFVVAVTNRGDRDLDSIEQKLTNILPDGHQISYADYAPGKKGGANTLIKTVGKSLSQVKPTVVKTGQSLATKSLGARIGSFFWFALSVITGGHWGALRKADRMLEDSSAKNMKNNIQGMLNPVVKTKSAANSLSKLGASTTVKVQGDKVKGGKVKVAEGKPDQTPNKVSEATPLLNANDEDEDTTTPTAGL